MARLVTVSVEGGEEMERKFEQLSNAVAGQVLEDAVLAALEPVTQAMITRAPVKTGKLKESIRAEVVETDAEHCDAVVGPHVRYAHLVEFGHVQKVGDRVVGHVPAHPFARPAWKANKDKAIETIADKIRKAVEAAVQ